MRVVSSNSNFFATELKTLGAISELSALACGMMINVAIVDLFVPVFEELFTDPLMIPFLRHC